MISRSLTSGQLLSRNVFLNILGQAAPMAGALLTIPILIGGIGIERFAVLTLAWMTLGYFTFFDLGLSRALTHALADRLGANETRDVPELISTGLILITALGIVGGGVLAGLSPWLVHSVLNVPPDLQTETLDGFLLISFGLPWVISAGCLRGVLEAYQRFDLINVIRAPTAVFTYLAPLAALPFSTSLATLIGVIVSGRVIGWGAHYILCRRAVPGFPSRLPFRRRFLALLVRFGGWMTASNVINPLLAYSDRFVIGALLPVAAVAFYVTPYEVVTRLWLVPVAITEVLFPALATARSQNAPRARDIFDAGIRLTVFAVFPAVLLFSTMAPEGLALWLGDEFAGESAVVLRWLAAGVIIHSVGQVASAAIQGAGRPDLTAKLNAAELPVYLGALWWLVATYGILGAAVAWTLRAAVDTAVLLVMSDRLLPGRAVVTPTSLLMLASISILFCATLPDSTGARIALLALTLPATGLAGWRWGLDRRGREAVAGLMGLAVRREGVGGALDRYERPEITTLPIESHRERAAVDGSLRTGS